MATSLDFYAPAENHRVLNKEKLGRQRDAMFSWRKSHIKTMFDPKTGARVTKPKRYEMDAKQVIIPGSEREADLLKLEKQKNETIWDYTSYKLPDRRRTWRATGFTFEDTHFRRSDDSRSPYHIKNQPPISAALLRAKRKATEEHPYKPYFHDGLLLAAPPGMAVAALAVTWQKREGAEREVTVARAIHHARRMGQISSAEEDPHAPPSWCEALGPEVSCQQRQLELARSMYSDLVERQAMLTSTDFGSQESKDLRAIPTCEIAFTLRDAYLEKHKTSVPKVEEERKEDKDQHALPPLPAPTLSSDVEEAEEEKEEEHLPPAVEETVEEPMTKLPPVKPATQPHLLPTEAKGVRLYAIQLRRYFLNEESGMVRRQDPLRQGKSVVLPSSWQASYSSSS